MRMNLNKNEQLTRKKLFGVRDASQTIISVTTTHNVEKDRCSTQKALLEAERKKAEAITILRRFKFH